MKTNTQIIVFLCIFIEHFNTEQSFKLSNTLILKQNKWIIIFFLVYFLIKNNIGNAPQSKVENKIFCNIICTVSKFADNIK